MHASTPSRPADAPGRRAAIVLVMLGGLTVLGCLATVVAGIGYFALEARKLDVERARFAPLLRERAFHEATRALSGFRSESDEPPLVGAAPGERFLPHAWSSIATLRTPARSTIEGDARIALVDVSGSRPQLSPAQLELPESLRAREPREVRWLALIRAVTVRDAYVLDGGADRLDVESMDVRLVVYPSGDPVALATIEAVPPERIHERTRRFEVRDADLVELVSEMIEKARRPLPSAPAPSALCVADRMAAGATLGDAPAACAHGATDECLEACFVRNEAASCLDVGYALEDEEVALALAGFRHACTLGATIGCTNWGANVRSAEDSAPEDLDCVARVFRQGCARDEPFACGMWGFVLAEGTGVDADPAFARSVLDASCARLGQFACAAAGRLLADGSYGTVDEAGANVALARACETGYLDACEQTAATFAPSPRE